MAVQNIECQIATVLMKRFLDGDNLPQNLLDDLEQHLKVCPGCQAVLNTEHADIEEILDGVTEPKGVSAWVGKLASKPATIGGFATVGPSQALMNASYKTYAPQAPGMAVLKNPKVLFLSLALAAVLIVMSTLLKNPTQFLGTKATAGNLYTEPKEEHSESATDEEHKEPEGEHKTDEELPSEEPHTEEGHEATADSHTTSAEEPHKQPELVPDPRVPGVPTLNQNDLIVVDGKGDTKAHEKEEKPQTKSTSTTQHQSTSQPKKSTKTSTSSKKSTAPAPRRPAPKKSSGAKPASGGSKGGIKVYDENGKPIH